jgi:hypothetical protein
MASSPERMPPRSRRANVEVSPSEVDAGADLNVKLSCVPAEDLRGRTLSIKDENGALVEGIDAPQADAQPNDVLELLVKAPIRPGPYTWLATSPANAEGGNSSEEIATSFSFTVKPHATRLVVWGVPSAVETGQKFGIKVGVKCACECGPDDWAIEIRDHDTKTLATARPSGEPWPGTDALYTAELELTAPDAEGLHQWEARFPATALGTHSDCTASFGVRVVTAAECRLTVVAVDMESKAPVSGAKVVVHPYRTSTDERGVAELNVPKGKFRLFVSGRNYLPFRSDGEATEEVTIRAELVPDVGPSDADIWS